MPFLMACTVSLSESVLAEIDRYLSPEEYLHEPLNGRISCLLYVFTIP